MKSLSRTNKTYINGKLALENVDQPFFKFVKTKKNCKNVFRTLTLGQS